MKTHNKTNHVSQQSWSDLRYGANFFNHKIGISVPACVCVVMWAKRKEYPMKKIAFIGGVLCLLYVGIGLIAGLLPVDFWYFILDLFIDRQPNTYYKIVPAARANYQIVFVTLVGIALIVVSKIK